MTTPATAAHTADGNGARPPEAPQQAGDPLDLRLAVGAAAAWLAAVGCLRCGAGWTAAVGGSCAVAGIAALLARRARVGAVIALVLFAVALVLLPLAARLQRAASSPLLALARAHASAELTVTVRADPRTLAAKGVAGTARVAVEAQAERVTVSGRQLSTGGRVLLLGDADDWAEVLPGQRALVSGELAPDLSGSILSVTVFERGPPRLLGRPPWWQRAAGAIRGALRRAAAVLPSQERGLLPGLVDGDTSALDPVLADRFRLAGLTHLVAVSGTNCSLLLGAVLLTARRLRARRSVQVLLGVLVLVVFVLVARPSPSVLRAAVMALVALGALASGRPRAALPGLAAATLLLLVWDPTLAVSASFTMSVLATAALLLLAPGWARRLRRHRLPAGLAESAAVAAAAHVVTAPVVAAISGQVSVVAVAANVLAEPVVSAVTVLGFAAAVVAPVWLGGGEALAWLAGWPCRWLVGVADYFGGLRGAVLPWPGGAAGGLALFGLLLLICVLAVRSGARRTLAAMGATALVLLIPVRSVVSGWPPHGWLFAACDVGQGDALLLPVAGSTAIEIDAGPDPVAIDRCLRGFGIHRLFTVFLTHYDADHVNGLPGAVRGRRVDRILTGPLAAPEHGVRVVGQVAAQRGLQVRSPPPGTLIQAGQTTVRVLAPPGPSDSNDSSLIMMATVRGVRILLTGDSETSEQEQLVDSGADLHADILKIPHHGSAYSSPRFLAAAHATVGVISVGAHNDYGHPSPVLLTEMAKLGVPLFRTDRDGDVAFTGSPGHIRAVLHGTASSAAAGAVGRATGAGRRATSAEPVTAVNLPRARPGRPVPRPAVALVSWPAHSGSSAPGARMASCRPAPSASTTCPTRCHRCSCSSATRSCSSTAPSARSPPRRAAPTRGSPRRR